MKKEGYLSLLCGKMTKRNVPKHTISGIKLKRLYICIYVYPLYLIFLAYKWFIITASISSEKTIVYIQHSPELEQLQFVRAT